MAGTIGTTTVTFNPSGPDRGRLNCIAIPWTSDATGAASGPIVDQRGNPIVFTGVLTQAVFVPSSVAAPTDQYDITITGAAGDDVLLGIGANLSNSATKRETPVTSTSAAPVSLAETLTLNVSNAGNAKSGTVYLYWR